MAELLNIMLSAAGRRVELLRRLEESLRDVGLSGRVIATDITFASPAMQLAGERVIVPPYRDPDCLRFLLDLCREKAVRLIVPTIDPDLSFYARHAGRFAEIGTAIHIASPECIEIGRDKLRTFEWLSGQGIPTVRTRPLEEVIDAAWEGPVLVKPRFGSASVGVRRAATREQLGSWRSEPNLLVQTIAPGREYTVDVYVDRAGKCRCAVPRLRIETRGGEVSKGVTVRQPDVAEAAVRVAEALPGAWGVMNIQMFHDEDSGAVNVIEINPRFGGGYPLTHAAGAPMARWVLEELTGRPLTAAADQWTDGMVMLRYDEAVFVSRGDAGLDPRPASLG